MRGAKSITSRRVRRSPGDSEAQRPESRHAQELTALAVDAAQSRHVPAFLERFSARAASMIGAAWSCVAVFRGRETDMYAAAETLRVPSTESQAWLVAACRESRTEIEVRSLAEVRPFPFSKSLAVAAAILVPISASDGERLGTLCLLHKKASLRAGDRTLLRALASHAALSLENFRRFSQLERSKRQWVEDIDAISDFIVVHDRAWKIVRTNRSLASHLGVPPAALVGEPVASLRQIAESGSELPCPFCH